MIEPSTHHFDALSRTLMEPHEKRAFAFDYAGAARAGAGALKNGVRAIAHEPGLALGWHGGSALVGAGAGGLIGGGIGAAQGAYDGYNKPEGGGVGGALGGALRGGARGAALGTALGAGAGATAPMLGYIGENMARGGMHTKRILPEALNSSMSMLAGAAGGGLVGGGIGAAHGAYQGSQDPNTGMLRGALQGGARGAAMGATLGGVAGNFSDPIAMKGLGVAERIRGALNKTASVADTYRRIVAHPVGQHLPAAGAGILAWEGGKRILGDIRMGERMRRMQAEHGAH